MNRYEKIKCLECGEMIALDKHADIGDIVTCEHCYGDFEITRMDPVKMISLNAVEDADYEYEYDRDEYLD